MDHKNQLKKSKYKNWVKGGLALKYLKDGIVGFVDEIVKLEHTRIIKEVKQTTVLVCTHCNFRNLKPQHKHSTDTTTGKYCCPWGQVNCNCLDKKKKPCPNKVCDTIFEEVLKCHSSTPPAPNWKNTDIHKWCSNPLEIAKCYIKAPGYADKVTINDIDVQGLLQILIHSINLQSHFDCNISGDDIFNKTLIRRNTLFHSPSMEMDDNELDKCIDDIIAILEDEKELKRRSDSKEAVSNLKQLKQRDFHITTCNEADVCKEAMAAHDERTRELDERANDIQTMINNSKRDLESRRADLLQEQQEQGSQVKSLDIRMSSLELRVGKIETEMSELKERLEGVKKEVDVLNTSRDFKHDHLEYLKQKQDLQERLVERYQNYYVKTSICPLKSQENDIDINEVYTRPDMRLERNTTYSKTIKKTSRMKWPETMYGSHIDQYEDIFETDGHKNRRIYILGEAGSGKSSFCKMMIQNWCKCLNGETKKTVTQTSISSYDCSAYDRKFIIDIPYEYFGYSDSYYDSYDSDVMDSDNYLDLEDKKQMKKFQFLFFIPLHCMSGFSNDILDMIASVSEDIASKQLIDKILQIESEKCLIIADGLDEWSPAEFNKPVLLHATQGIPNLSKVKDATVILLSRPSAKGILNMKSSESDLKIHLLGVRLEDLNIFVEKYMAKLGKKYLLHTFRNMVAETKLQNLEKTPMLLQQVLWMYCCEQKIGNSTSDVYSRIVNTMLAWNDGKQNEEEPTINIRANADDQHENWQLPRLFNRFPRCISSQSIICPLSEVAFQTLLSSAIFSRSDLKKKGLSNDDISTVLKLGLVREENCFDPSYEKTQLSFTHKSFHECFAALCITSHCPKNQQSIENNQTSNIDKLFKGTRSVDDILQLENMLILVCGFSPYIITQMSKRIYEAVLNDEQIVEYRKMPPRDRMVLARKVLQVQRLISKCAAEAELNGLQDLRTLMLCDIQLCDFTETSLLQKIITNKVLSLNMFAYGLQRCEIERISEMRQIQSLYISQEDDKCLPHECCNILASFLSHVVTLRSIHLLGVTCQMKECNGHSFDLSKNQELGTVSVQCLHMCVSDINSNALESFTVDSIGFHEDNFARSFSSSLSSSLSDTRYLRYLDIKGMDAGCNEIEHRSIDLSGNEELQALKITDSKYLSISNVYSITLQSCVIENCILSHNQCELFSSALQKSIGLERLVLNHIRCDKKCCEGHIISMVNAKKLQSLTMCNCEYLCVSSISQSNLKSCKIMNCLFAHEQYALLSTLLSQSSVLRQLDLSGIRCKSQICEGHSVALSHCDQLDTLLLDHGERLFITNVCFGKLKNCTVEDFLYLSSSDSKIALSQLELNACKTPQNLLGTESASQRSNYRIIYLHENQEFYNEYSSRKETQNLAYLLFDRVCSGLVDHFCLLSCTIKDCHLSHNLYDSLLLKLEEAASLRQLEMHNIRCGQNMCNGHIIKLAKFTGLEAFTLTKCKSLSVSHVCSVKLSSYVVKNCIFPDKPRTQLLSSKSKVISSSTLEIDDAAFDKANSEEQQTDPSKQLKLRRLVMMRCTNPRLPNINTSVLTKCYISGCTFSHEQYTAFTSSLRFALQIASFCFSDLRCSSNHQCHGHSIDLSNKAHLMTLKIHNCAHLRILNICSKSLSFCQIDNYTMSHGECNSLLSSIEQAVSLRYLKLCNTRFDRCETKVKALNLSKHLKNITLMACNDLFFSNIRFRSVRYLMICNQALSHQNCLTLSLLFKHAVSIKRLKISHVQCRENLCEGHMIDTTETGQLISIKIIRCRHLYLSHCPLRLEAFRLDDCRLPHETYECLAVSLTQSKSLKRLELNNINCMMATCDGHISDLSELKELHIIDLLNCKQLSVLNICSSTIQSCRISNYLTSHAQFRILLSSLEEATLLEQLELTNVQCDKNECDGHDIDLSKHAKLQSISFVRCKHMCASSIDGSMLGSVTVRGCALSHEECTLLTTTVTQTKGLKQLELENISCSQDRCEGHTVNLTEHTKLQTLSFQSCGQLFLLGINCSGLISVSADICFCEQNHFLKDLSSLSEAIHLRQLRLNGARCSSQTKIDQAPLDLAHCRSLQSVDMVACECIPILNVAKLEMCSFTNCVLQHDQYSLLCSSLRQAKHLRQIKFRNIKCIQSDCSGHSIDLTSLPQLLSLTLVGCWDLHAPGFDFSVLESCVVRDCELTHKQFQLLVSFLTGAVSLQRLTLSNVRCTEDMCGGHTLDLSKHTNLKNLALVACKHFSVSGVNSTVLESCTIQDLDILHQTFSKLLANLTDSAFLKHLKLCSVKCLSDNECTGHTVSFSKLVVMQSLVVMSCKHLCVTNITSKVLEVFTLSDSVILHELGCQLNAFLATAFSLKRLKLCNIKCNLEGCDGHAVDLSRLRLLEYSVLENCEQVYKASTG
ncbi:uncharacterized protein LOC128554179 [Mercenaria mercenaria]|uniref:uncharacterized protein LOC128554179 n=1 Tax=Mercenaria mercenaria TaxID=6596 RepID=UPI00234EC52D|nr:uncharacterized protein LOC128554179 [Mercenaria mercenaria]XP_053391403.1 uncharacterized protein LOC128554179 [Mercenaria mercenaria]